MSIDYLWDLEREIDNGKEYYACPGAGRNQWVIEETVEDLEPLAQKMANSKGMPVHVVLLIPYSDAVPGDLYLVPTKIKDPGPRGDARIEWTVVETKEASEMMRDLRHGQAPYFGMQQEKTFDPVEKD